MHICGDEIQAFLLVVTNYSNFKPFLELFFRRFK